MNIYDLKSYVITINPDRMKQRFYSHATPEIFPGIKDTKNKLVGGLQSHLKLWETIVSLYKKDQYILIFEDDAFLCRKITDNDQKAINIFLNEIHGDIMLLGYNPNINNFAKTKTTKLLYGHALDIHAYIIKVDFADYLYNKYSKKMNSYLHKKLLPIGHIDTPLLIHKVYAIYPMLYTQKNDPRYDNVLAQKGLNYDTNQLLYSIYKTINYLHHTNFLIPVSVSVIILIICAISAFYLKKV